MLEKMPEDLLDRMPEDMPENMPDRMLENMPDSMPEGMPDRRLDRMPEGMPDEVQEYAACLIECQIECQVGCEKICEIPSKFALIKYVLGCASDVGCCMKPAKTIGDSQKNDTFFDCAFLRVLLCGHTVCLARVVFITFGSFSP